MLLLGNEHTVRMVLSLLIEEKGKDWKLILPPLNPDNTNFMRIVNADVHITPTSKRVPYSWSARYSIGIYGHLHQRNKCECFSNPQQERILINFKDEMGLPIEGIKFIGENPLDIEIAPCMKEGEV